MLIFKFSHYQRLGSHLSMVCHFRIEIVWTCHFLGKDTWWRRDVYIMMWICPGDLLWFIHLTLRLSSTLTVFGISSTSTAAPQLDRPHYLVTSTGAPLLPIPAAHQHSIFLPTAMPSPTPLHALSLLWGLKNFLCCPQVSSFLLYNGYIPTANDISKTSPENHEAGEGWKGWKKFSN